MEMVNVSALAEAGGLRPFMEFPIPLALFHADGHLETTNGR